MSLFTFVVSSVNKIPPARLLPRIKSECINGSLILSKTWGNSFQRILTLQEYLAYCIKEGGLFYTDASGYGAGKFLVLCPKVRI